MPLSTKSTVRKEKHPRIKVRAPAAKTFVISAPAVKDSKQRAQAVAQLNHLIRGDRKTYTTDQATYNVVVSSTPAESSKVTA